MLRRPWSIALTTLAALLIASYLHEIFSNFAVYQELHRSRPFFIAESIDKIAGVIICFLAVWLMRGTGLRDIFFELGLSAAVLPGIAFALGVSLPMLVGFAISRSLTPHIEILPLLFLSVFSPMVEEIEFRGFGVRQLQRGTGWPFWVVVWPSALLCGYGHVEQGGSLLEMTGLFFLTAAGGVVFAWLVKRWDSLWVAMALHICMNLWWELFSVSNSAIGGWLPFVLQTFTILLAIIGTLYFTKSKVGINSSS